jgi:hypothetical protein
MGCWIFSLDYYRNIDTLAHGPWAKFPEVLYQHSDKPRKTNEATISIDIAF